MKHARILHLETKTLPAPDREHRRKALEDLLVAIVVDHVRRREASGASVLSVVASVA